MGSYGEMEVAFLAEETLLVAHELRHYNHERFSEKKGRSVISSRFQSQKLRDEVSIHTLSERGFPCLS